MRIVYVGDNRNRGNFGCRATSTALSQIIGKENEIVGVVSGEYTNSDKHKLFFRQWFPSVVYRLCGKINNWKYIKTVFNYFSRMIKKSNYYFSSYDFIQYDLDRSIKNLIRCLPANPELNEMDLRQYEFDALVVNGEGSFIFSTPAWRECLVELMLMHWAIKMKKKVFYLNGMLSDDPFSKRNVKTLSLVKKVFSKCEVIQVREMQSYIYAKKILKLSDVCMKPDALFSWFDYINDEFEIKNGKYFIGPSGADDKSFDCFDFTKPYICIAGSSSVGLATKSLEKIINVYVNLIKKIKKEMDYQVYLIEDCEGDAFLREVSRKTNVNIIPIDTPIMSAAKILANARVFISGRYHPSILASLGGTPCVFMSSNSHKTKSLQETLGYDNIIEYPVLPNDMDCFKIINDAKDKINQGEKLRNDIISHVRELSVYAKEISQLIK